MTVSPPPGAPARLGAIDVGSNSVRLLVAEFTAEGGLRVIDELKDQPRLAGGLAQTGRLDPAAMDRAASALARMREVATRRGVTELRAVATSAVREATNGPEFVARIREDVGIPLTVIDADTEARLSWRSVAHHFQLDDRRTLMLDIGGGSLEVIGAVRSLVELSLSLPLGAVRLTEMFLHSSVPLHRAIYDLRRKIRRALRKTGVWREWNGARIFGSGGTFTNLARIAAARRGLPTTAIHGTSVTTAEVEHLLEWLAAMPAEERRTVPGLNPERADIILAGLAVTAEVLARVHASAVTVSAYGLREGLVLEMAGAGVEANGDPLAVAREFAHRCQCDPQHIEQVRRLSLQLFDRLGPVLGAGPEERRLLEAAALLHDVGQLISYRKRERHSHELITHAERLPFSARDRHLIALIARYHRKDRPSKRDADFAALRRKDRDLVRRLAALLRVADGLDRGYSAEVEAVRTRLTDRRLRITPVPREPGADLALECWGAQRRTDLLARLLDRAVVVAPAAVPRQ